MSDKKKIEQGLYNLLIVESPAKAKTIETYLGTEFKVISSVGHIRDLATTGPGGLGIDVENHFAPTYKTITGKTKVVNEIKKLAKDATKVYIATDPDREGEAIGWHIAEIVKEKNDNITRICFYEITKDAVQEAITKQEDLDLNLVASQETRRMIDRIMGFKLSKIMQTKIKAKSAGRVQSVALLLIVEREREIRSFIVQYYYKLFAEYKDFEIEYVDNNKNIDEDLIKGLLDDCLNTNLEVINVGEKTTKTKSKPIYTTSTYQQDAVNKLNITSRKAMSIAQKLYEGIDVGSGLTGLITYMRTDSIRMSDEFRNHAMGYVGSTFGDEYVNGYFYKGKQANSQEAHEGIRPTSISNTPSKIKKYLTAEQYKVYKLIWERSISSVMKESITLTTTTTFKNENDINFKYVSSVYTFDGYLKAYSDREFDAKAAINLNVGDVIEVNKYYTTAHETKPKPRYTEARLIKELEESGVGRPSTYASIIDTLKKRNYVEFAEKKFKPTEMGEEVTNSLEKHFSEIINVSYTSVMESELDQIATGEIQKDGVLEEFYKTFMHLVEEANEKMEKKPVEYTGEKCPECGSELVYRNGCYGKFKGCSNFPKCRYIENLEPVETFGTCPKCKEGNVIKRKNKRGRDFYCCDTYPKCDFITNSLEDIKS